MDDGTPGACALLERVAGSRLLASLSALDRRLIGERARIVQLHRGDVLVEQGDDVAVSYFPSLGTVVSLVLLMADGRSVEVATIGAEGAAGGIVSSGHKPAFARSVVQIGGTALRVAADDLAEMKGVSPQVADLFSRYADFLVAQVMQSVACNTFHALDARCCRWLLTTHDRVAGDAIPLTHEALAEMLGVQRTTVTRVVGQLQERGLVRNQRGRFLVMDRDGLEEGACECYQTVEAHFRSVLPEQAPERRDSTGPAR
jgi:CRP-like cAMP-binding protein